MRTTALSITPEKPRQAALGARGASHQQTAGRAHCLAIALAGSVFIHAAALAQPADARPNAAHVKNHGVSDLVDASDAESRDKTASKLLQEAGADRRLSAALVELLAGKSTPDAVRISVLDAIARFDLSADAHGAEAPDSMWSGVAAVLASDAPNNVQRHALAAAVRFQSREAVGDVLAAARAWGDHTDREELVAAALATIAAQTGGASPSGDLGAVDEWFKGTADWSKGQWSACVARALARANRQLAQRNDALGQSLAEVYRRLVLATPEDDRSPLIVEMLSQPTPPVVHLGLDLATRAVLNGQMPGDKVASTVAQLLRNPDTQVRSEAVSLLEKLDYEPAAAEVAANLQKEHDAGVAASMLRFLARHPRPEARDDIAAWLDSTGPAFAPAVDASLALIRAGRDQSPLFLDRVHTDVHSVAESRLTPSCVMLLGEVGADGEVARLLNSARPEIVLAAGQTLSRSSTHFGDLLSAAQHNPSLFAPAVDAIARFRLTAPGFAAAEALSASSSEIRREALAKLAASLAPRDMLAVASRQSDLTLREAYARAAEDPRFFSFPADGANQDVQARQDLLLLLVRTRLQLRNPAGALAALDANAASATTEPLIAQRVTALAWLNRLDEAARLTMEHHVPARAWLDALTSSIDADHARAIRERIRELYSTGLSADEQTELAALDVKLAPSK